MSTTSLRKHACIGAMAVLSVIVFAASSHAATPAEKFQKRVTKKGAKTLCICQDGTANQDMVGTIGITGLISSPYMFATGCAIPKFNVADGETSNTTYCYDYIMLP